MGRGEHPVPGNTKDGTAGGRVRALALGIVWRSSRPEGLRTPPAPGGEILVCEYTDSVRNELFYRPLGGTVEFGEYSRDALRREFREELGAELADPCYLATMENVYTYEGEPGHEIVLLYETRLADPALYEQDSLPVNENGTMMTARWVSLETFLAADGPPLYPGGLIQVLLEGVTQRSTEESQRNTERKERGNPDRVTQRSTEQSQRGTEKPQRNAEKKRRREARVNLTGLNALTEDIIGAAIEVHRHLGPGLLESAYEACLVYELEQLGLAYERQKGLPLVYKEIHLDQGYRMDLVVERQVVVEVKAVEQLTPVHEAQVLSYLRLSGCPIGLLLNFDVKLLKDDIQRLIRT